MKLKNIIFTTLLASGSLHADEQQQSINIDIDGQQGKILIVENNNGELKTVEKTFIVDDKSDIQQQVDAILKQHGIAAKDKRQTTINMAGSGGQINISQRQQQDNGKKNTVHKQIIKINRSNLNQNSQAGLGLILDQHPKGWRVLSVGKQNSESNGIKIEDIITHVNGKAIIKDQISSPNQLRLNSKQANSIQIIRDQKPQTLSIKTTEQSRPDILISTTMTQLVDIEEVQAISEQLGIDQNLSPKQIYINTDHLDSNNLISFSFPGNKLRQWLGNKHHFSTVTESLGAYFGVTQGVLVLEVDSDNSLGLKDGDVIQVINKQPVYTPKDVVKILSRLSTDQALEIELIRHKKAVYLKS